MPGSSGFTTICSALNMRFVSCQQQRGGATGASRGTVSLVAGGKVQLAASLVAVRADPQRPGGANKVWEPLTNSFGSSDMVERSIEKQNAHKKNPH